MQGKQIKIKTSKKKKIRAKSKCPKCGNNEFEVGKYYAVGSKLARIFDIQNKRFTAITCTKCLYTELYKTDTSNILNVLNYGVG